MEELKKIILENNKKIIELKENIKTEKIKIKMLSAENEDCFRQILEN